MATVPVRELRERVEWWDSELLRSSFARTSAVTAPVRDLLEYDQAVYTRAVVIDIHEDIRSHGASERAAVVRSSSGCMSCRIQRQCGRPQLPCH